MKQKKGKNKGRIKDIFLRYGIILLAAIANLGIFYYFFTPITAYPVYWILNLFFDASLIGRDVILINGNVPIELIRACIAGSAYFLLLALGFSVPNIKIEKRLKIVGITFLSFLLVNILRIVILAFIFMAGYQFFDAAHNILWYSVSVILVAVIWFAMVKKFNIKEIPFYSDIRFLYKRAFKSR